MCRDRNAEKTLFFSATASKKEDAMVATRYCAGNGNDVDVVTNLEDGMLNAHSKRDPGHVLSTFGGLFSVDGERGGKPDA